MSIPFSCHFRILMAQKFLNQFFRPVQVDLKQRRSRVPQIMKTYSGQAYLLGQVVNCLEGALDRKKTAIF